MSIFKSSTRKYLEDLDSDMTGSFRNVKSDVDRIDGRIDRWAQQFQSLRNAFFELRDELATNGVVRDLRKAEKEIAALKEQNANLASEMVRRFNSLNNNGVATAINKLNDEVFNTQRQKKSDIMSSLFNKMWGLQAEVSAPDATLAGKVDAILEYLKIDVEVQPEKVEKAKPVVKKKVAPKKGRK